MKVVQKGFTLIELMIVVAIIGILAAIALPAYQDYTIRTQVSEGPKLSEAIKTAAAEYFATNGNWPAANADLGYTDPISGTYVSDISTTGNGVIVVTYGNKAHANITGFTLSLLAAPNLNGDVAWVCGTAAAPAGHTPVGAAATTVIAKYLPSSCRV